MLLKKICSANILSVLLTSTILTLIPGVTQSAQASHNCSFWEIATFRCRQHIPGVPSLPAPSPQIASSSKVIRISGIAEECGAAQYKCGNFETDLIISDKFNSEQQDIISDAANIMAARMLTRRVISCTYKYANRNYTGQDNFKYGTDREHLSRMLYAAVLRDGYEGPPPNGDFIGDVYVDYFEENYTPGEPFTLGQAIIKYFSSGGGYYDRYHKNNPRKWHGRIELNAKVIGKDLPIDKNNAFALAGTMAHELLHNVGWTHPEGYPGTVIKEYGLCISRDGADKSSEFGLAPSVLDLIKD